MYMYMYSNVLIRLCLRSHMYIIYTYLLCLFGVLIKSGGLRLLVPGGGGGGGGEGGGIDMIRYNIY